MWVEQLLVKSWWNLIRSPKKNLIDLKLCQYFILLHRASEPAQHSLLLYLLKMKLGGNEDHQPPMCDVQGSSQSPTSTQKERARPLAWPNMLDQKCFVLQFQPQMLWAVELWAPHREFFYSNFNFCLKTISDFSPSTDICLPRSTTLFSCHCWWSRIRSPSFCLTFLALY